ncbi:helix-turn-helix domain-containing protein [Streptomyces sp. AV19]|uniref:helix-turn-helix domain-containing protein n=1 Tax=Streptomyces sp. AV19 TaxID=2793068 RepID=UPI0018FE404E|nr:helix-turn-helix transcriptional regulator [Streptomyces sp. AV19]MBH1934901.1 helix-turn-helix domain-containing protein [Streptomyces sp. AV19]MDG4537035.1 helix-turn-helix domain-containing protein [Streptomyces sp. AV19]
MAEQLPPNWRYCGNQVKLWRFRAGVSREELAQGANYTVETVKAMEQGRRRPTPRLLQVADDLCGAGGMLLAALAYLKPEPYAPNMREFLDVEIEAISICSYESLLIPGLLQTEAYARALMTGTWPPVDDETLEERLAGRLKRQEKLTRKPYATFNYVIYEAALRTGVGGPEVMKEQLHRLLEAGEMRNVTIQVLPIDKAPLIALTGPLLVLETADHERYGYVEGQKTRALYSQAELSSSFAQRFGHLRMEALSAEESARFIRKVADEL